MKNRVFAIAAVFSLPFAVLAQSETGSQPPPPSILENLFFSVLPVLLIGAFIWFFFIKNIRKMQNTSIDATKQHHEKVEKLLERIAKALEKRNGDAGGA